MDQDLPNNSTGFVLIYEQYDGPRRRKNGKVQEANQRRRCTCKQIQEVAECSWDPNLGDLSCTFASVSREFWYFRVPNDPESITSMASSDLAFTKAGRPEGGHRKILLGSGLWFLWQ